MPKPKATYRLVVNSKSEAAILSVDEKLRDKADFLRLVSVYGPSEDGQYMAICLTDAPVTRWTARNSASFFFNLVKSVPCKCFLTEMLPNLPKTLRHWGHSTANQAEAI